MRRARALALATALAACGPRSLPKAATTPGRAALVRAAPPLPEGHPALPVGEPASNNDHIGRAARRLSVEKLRASLLAATGFTWVASRRVSDPDAPGGTTAVPDADMLEALAATLGRPDYITSTSESIEPAVTFAKLAGDAARSACRASVSADVAAGDAGDARRILRFVGPADTLASNADGVRENLAYLALRFWGRSIAKGSAELGPLVTLFERASTAPAGKDKGGAARAVEVKATPADGWRAVCIAMATDPQFLTY
jgi:hypothetical protein